MAVHDLPAGDRLAILRGAARATRSRAVESMTPTSPMSRAHLVRASSSLITDGTSSPLRYDLRVETPAEFLDSVKKGK